MSGGVLKSGLHGTNDGSPIDEESYNFEDSPELRGGLKGRIISDSSVHSGEEDETAPDELEELRKKVVIYDAKYKIPNAQREAITMKNLKESGKIKDFTVPET